MDWLAIASHEVGHIKHIIQSNKLADQLYLTLLKARENSNGVLSFRVKMNIASSIM